MHTGFPKHLRQLLLGTSLLLAGCITNNCDIFSTSHSFGCNAMYAAAIVPAVPITVVSSAIDSHRDKARLADTWRRLQANDPTTVGACVLDCNLPEKLSKAEEHATYERSIEPAITWWGEHPQPAQMPALMKAYIYKQRRGSNGLRPCAS